MGSVNKLSAFSGRVKIMRKKNLWAALAALFLLFALSSESGAQNVHASGSQTRGTMGNSARLEGQPFYLPSPGTIISASSTGNGFWIQNAAGHVIAKYWEANQAIGVVLAAGSYYIFPNLAQGQNYAKAFALFNVGGAPPAAPGGIPGAAPGLVWVTSPRWGVSIMVPAGWVTRTDLANDVAIQAMEPGENAFIRVHAASGSGIKLEDLAVRFEGQRPYSIRRINQTVVNLSSGGHAFVTEYSGSYNGQPIGAGFLLTHTPGRYYIVEAVYVQSASGLYANTLGQCMGTINTR
jgi:hypothetical protein